MRRMAKAIYDKGAPLDHCIGFIDGTVRPITRPGLFQKEVYNGHKRQHALKFQSVMFPNGIIGHLFGPVEGRRHDTFLLTESGLMTLLQNHCHDDDGAPFYLYGDQAYPPSQHLISPFRGARLTEDEQQFNAEMCKVRLAVEWGFGKVISIFSFLDYKKGLKLWLHPVGKYYIIGTLLTNCHTCLYGSVTTSSFGVAPPLLEEYLH